MLQATIYRISRFSYLKNCRESEYSLYVILNVSFSFSKKKWNALFKNTARNQALFSSRAMQSVWSQGLSESL